MTMYTPELLKKWYPTVETTLPVIKKQEEQTNDYVEFCGGFRKMNKGEENIHNGMCKQWDRLKAHYNILKAEKFEESKLTLINQ